MSLGATESNANAAVSTKNILVSRWANVVYCSAWSACLSTFDHLEMAHFADLSTPAGGRVCPDTVHPA
jgi:BarA-like signal transduction histidine kinase